MNRRTMISALIAQVGTLKPRNKRLMQQDTKDGMTGKTTSAVRPWSVSNVVIKHFKLKPVNASSGTVGITLVGEDGQRYLLDDVIYAILHVVEVDLGLKPE